MHKPELKPQLAAREVTENRDFAVRKYREIVPFAPGTCDSNAQQEQLHKPEPRGTKRTGAPEQSVSERIPGPLQIYIPD